MKITLSRLSTKELATLTQRSIHSSKEGEHRQPENNPLLVELEKIYTDYAEVYVKPIYSGKGQSVAEADEERDRVFIGIKNFLNGYRQVPSVPNADKAAELYEIIKAFGTNINMLSYAEETAQMIKLIEELDKKSNKEKLTALSLHIAFEDLKTKQTNFEMIFAEQAIANADLRKVPSASTMRKNLERALRTYLDYLEVMKNLPQWKDLYQEIAELVKTARNSYTRATPKKPNENTTPKE